MKVSIRNGRPAQHVQSSYDGFLMMHRHEDQEHISDVIRGHRPERGVELGTASGGFAALLAATLTPWSGTVLSVDRVQAPEISRRLLSTYPNLALLEADVLWDVLPAIRDVISQPNSFLYTDNGRKMRELELYAPIMGPRALLGTHDYDTEVSADWVEPFLADLGYRPHQHARFEALANKDYWDSLTRWWTRD